MKRPPPVCSSRHNLRDQKLTAWSPFYFTFTSFHKQMPTEMHKLIEWRRDDMVFTESTTSHNQMRWWWVRGNGRRLISWRTKPTKPMSTTNQKTTNFSNKLIKRRSGWGNWRWKVQRKIILQKRRWRQRRRRNELEADEVDERWHDDDVYKHSNEMVMKLRELPTKKSKNNNTIMKESAMDGTTKIMSKKIKGWRCGWGTWKRRSRQGWYDKAYVDDRWPGEDYMKQTDTSSKI